MSDAMERVDVGLCPMVEREVVCETGGEEL